MTDLRKEYIIGYGPILDHPSFQKLSTALALCQHC